MCRVGSSSSERGDEVEVFEYVDVAEDEELKGEELGRGVGGTLRHYSLYYTHLTVHFPLQAYLQPTH